MDINWDEVIRNVKAQNPNTYGLLLSAKNMQIDDEIIRFQFASDVLRNQMRKDEHIAVVEGVLQALYDTNFILVCVNGDGEEYVAEEWAPPNVDIEKNTREFTAAFEELKSEQRQNEYLDYLESERWKRLREQILAFWDHRCVLCYSSRKVQVHHRTYARLGDEIFSDLIPLCEDCHRKHHNIIKPDYY